MNTANQKAIKTLTSARLVADYAKKEGALLSNHKPRSTYDHMGALLADSVLQAGLNYKTVVLPRVLNILESHDKRSTTSTLLEIVENKETSSFLNWNHHQKVERFESLVFLFSEHGIETTCDLKNKLSETVFLDELKKVKGVGPKTIDYMGCLIGVDSIAVDRHIKKFATMVGVHSDDYDFLRTTFCYAADFLSLSRRDFDAWVWQKITAATSPQQSLPL